MREREAHAALFCAFLLDCAGVMASFSSLLLLRPDGPSSISRLSALSVDFSAVKRLMNWVEGEVDIGMGVSPVPLPREEASKEP